MDQANSNEEIITKVEQQKRHSHRYNIYVNGEYAFAVHEDIIVKYRLLKDSIISEQFKHEVLAEEERHSAFRSALRYIGRAMRTELEIVDKLKAKGYEESTITAVILVMKQQQLINDAEYASALVRQRLGMNKKGPLWVKRELIQKGVSKEEIQAALEQFNNDDEFEQAWTLASKRWNQEKGDTNRIEGEGDSRSAEESMRHQAGLGYSWIAASSILTP